VIASVYVLHGPTLKLWHLLARLRHPAREEEAVLGLHWTEKCTERADRARWSFAALPASNLYSGSCLTKRKKD
jgi:hypothetical protein